MAFNICGCNPFSCFTSSDVDDPRSHPAPAGANPPDEALSPTSTGRDEENVDIDVDGLIKYISELLKRAEAGGHTEEERKKRLKQEEKLLKQAVEEKEEKKQHTSREWTLPTSSDLNALENFLSSGADLASDLASVISGPVKDILKGLGHASIAAAGLLVVAHGLERYEQVSTNRKECLHLLHEMHYVANIVKRLKGSPEEMRDVLEDATSLIVHGAITCYIHIKSSKWEKFWSASGDKEKLSDITKRLDDMYKKIAIEMTLRLVNDIECKEKPPLPRTYPENAVGIQKSIEQVTDLLDWGNKENARAVILHGFGGMGKTILADAVFSLLDIPGCKYSRVKLFQDIGSTANIEESQKRILEDLMGSEKIPDIRGYEEGQRQLGHMLEKVPALIYIDNVLDKEALRQLLPPDMNKAKKVRLLITARESNVVKACSMNRAPELYPMEGMASADAESLLQKEMFVDPRGILDSKQINDIIKKCGGIPLMLKLVAASVRVAKDKPQEVRKVIEQMESLTGEDFRLDEIEKYFFPYEKLPEECKDPFLDICFFFHGWDWETVADIVGESELSMLESRALVSKGTNGVVSVHDIILEMGRHKSEGVRFRFSTANEAKEFLDNTEKDIKATKGVWLNEIKDPMDISASKLDLMHNSLRVLAFESLIEVKGECTKIFKELIFFKAKITHLPFRVSKLKGLKYLNYTPKDLKLSEMPSSLRHVEFDGTLHAHAFQISSKDLQQLVNLRILKLNYFYRLKNLPQDMGNLVNRLKELSLSGCLSIKELPQSISNIQSLQILRVDQCRNLTKLPEDFTSLKSLQELHLNEASLKELPSSVTNLSSLKLLDLSNCWNLSKLPPDLGNLRGLVKLDLASCYNLKSIPESIRELKLLQPTLDMSDCSNVKELPHGFCNLSYITHLSLAYCERLEKLPDGFGELASLRLLDLTDCVSLQKLPKGFGQLKCLEELVLKDCSQLRELCDDFHCLSSLQNLDLSGCLKLGKLPADFQCLASLQHLYLRSCHKLEGKIWMDHLVKMHRLQVVNIKGSEQLVNRWAEIQRECHESWPFVVTAGQYWSMSEDKKENIERTLRSHFDLLLTNGRGEPFRLSDLPPGTQLHVVCEVYRDFFISHFPWRLIEETVDEMQTQFPIIYIGPHFSELPKKVQDKVIVGHMSVTGACEVLEKVYSTLDVHEDADSYKGPHCFQMHTKMLENVNSDKYLPSWKLLTDSEMEEYVLGNCRRYLRLKQLVGPTQGSNIKLLTELFTPAENIFQKYQSEEDRAENSEPFTCGVDKLKGKNILLEMSPANSSHDIRLSSLKKMYDTERERLDLEIISIPIVEPDTSDIYEQFSKQVPWLILRNSWTIITRAVIFFLVKDCGWEGGDESEKCHTSIIWMIESNGGITTYKPSLYCKLEKWEVLFNHLESVSYQVRWGAQVRWREMEELKKEEWKQLNSMSTFEFIFNHLESASDQVREIMFKGKMICLFYGIDKEITSYMLNSMMDVRDSIHIIYIPGVLKTFELTDTIAKEYYHSSAKTAEMEGMFLLNLSGNEGARFWMRLLHLKEDINGMYNTDKQFCEMKRFLQSCPLVRETNYAGCMIFMGEDGKMVATCSNEILMQLFRERVKDIAKRLMQLLIKFSMEEGRQTHHDSSTPRLTNDIQTAAIAIDQETVDLNLDQEIVGLDLDSLSKYTSNLLEHEELHQFWEFNKNGERSSRPSARHQWPTSKGFSMLKDFLSEGIDANWVKASISRHPEEEDKWKTVTKSLLKGIGEEHWAVAGLLVVADVLERFETISANRNECLFLLEEMNTLAIYLKQFHQRCLFLLEELNQFHEHTLAIYLNQFDERSGLWTGVKREATASIVIGSIMCCAQIDHPKFAMFIKKPIDENLLESFKCELKKKSNIMAGAITGDLGGETESHLEDMCHYMMDFVTGDLESESENEGGPSAENESGPSSNATHDSDDAQPDVAPSVAASSSSS